MKWMPTRQTGRVMLFKTDDKDIAMRTSAHIAGHPINPILGGFRLILRDRWLGIAGRPIGSQTWRLRRTPRLTTIIRRVINLSGA